MSQPVGVQLRTGSHCLKALSSWPDPDKLCTDGSRVLKPAPYVLQGLFEVFEVQMVHTYATFADVPLAALLGEAPMPEQACPSFASISAMIPYCDWGRDRCRPFMTS